MPFCVYSSSCTIVASVFFKGRWFCLDHAMRIKQQLEQIIAIKEKREGRVIPSYEKIPINNPRYAKDKSERIVKIRGTHMTISKKELSELETPVFLGASST